MIAGLVSPATNKVRPTANDRPECLLVYRMIQMSPVDSQNASVGDPHLRAAGEVTCKVWTVQVRVLACRLLAILPVSRVVPRAVIGR